MTVNNYVAKGEDFLKRCVFHGLAHSYDVQTHRYVKPYPEVTGYVIKYFCDYGDDIPSNIVRAANKLVGIQDKKTGGYASFDNDDILFAFDTSQILIGLTAIYRRTKKKKYMNAALRAGDFLLMMQMDNGAIAPAFDRRKSEIVISEQLYSIWNGPWSGLMCKLTEGFQALYDLSNDEKYLRAKVKTADFYANAEYIECTHPLGYWLEGLYEGGKYDKVDEILKGKVIPRIRDNGYIAYREDLDYAYTSGIVQLGIILYKRGFMDEAESIRSFTRTVQSNNNSGGIIQYCDDEGAPDNHIHREINSWGTKYFCELERIMDKAAQ